MNNTTYKVCSEDDITKAFSAPFKFDSHTDPFPTVNGDRSLHLSKLRTKVLTAYTVDWGAVLQEIVKRV